MLFDSHAHLNDVALIERTEDILANAIENKVEKILCVGFDKDSSLLAVELANQYESIYAAIGIHPSEANQFEIDLDWMKEYLGNPKVVAVGEIGLDYYWDKSKIEEQKQLFQRQMELAGKYHLPVIIHMRDATNDTFEMLREYMDKEASGVMHCYSSSKEAMQQFLDLGMYISLAGPVTFKNARVPKEVAEVVPLEKLLVETDSPYLSPVPYRGKTNEPKNVFYVAQEIARIKKVSFEEIEAATYANTCRLFGIK